MGNGCICIKNICNQYQDIKLDSLLEEQILNDKDNEQLEVTNLYNIVKYFNEGEKEINTKIEKQKVRRILSHKKAKHLKSYNKKGDSKYELMLKRILEQKNIERKGPKRRKTLRINNNKDLINLIENVIKENENNKTVNDKNQNQNIDNTKNESILLNHKDKKKLINGRQSVNINKFEQRKIRNDFEETEISNSIMLNDKNNNISIYISDANYACLPRNYSPKK